MENEVIRTLMQRKSVRTFLEQMPEEEVIETIVRAGQQAPFAYQLGSLVLDRSYKNPFRAPLLFVVNYDIHRMAIVAEKRGWQIAVDDLQLMIFGVQDAAYMAQNMVIAAESLGLASCYLGVYPFIAPAIKKKYHLPERVFPVVGLVMGYPHPDEEVYPPRPRYPLSFTCHENQYQEPTEEQIEEAMKAMDEGYRQQGYYARQQVMIPLRGAREETYTFDNYSWCEHISRKVALYTDMNLRSAYEQVGFVMPPSSGYTPDNEEELDE